MNNEFIWYILWIIIFSGIIFGFIKSLVYRLSSRRKEIHEWQESVKEDKNTTIYPIPKELEGIDELTGEKHIVGHILGHFNEQPKVDMRSFKELIRGQQSFYPQTADEYAEILNERMTSLFNYCLERKNRNITDSEMKEYFDYLQMHCAYGPPDSHESFIDQYKNDTWFHADDFKVPGQYQVIISRRTNRKEIHINFASFGPPESDDLTGLMITTTAIDGNRENKLNFYCSAKRFNEDDKLGKFSEAVRDKLINDYEGYSGGYV